jgi:hypothetical protein
MMIGPGDEMAAGAGRPRHLRTSHADREQVIDVLKTAFVQDGSPGTSLACGLAERSRRGPMRTWMP